MSSTKNKETEKDEKEEGNENDLITMSEMTSNVSNSNKKNNNYEEKSDENDNDNNHKPNRKLWTKGMIKHFETLHDDYYKLSELHGLCEEFYNHRHGILYLFCIIAGTLASILSAYDTTTISKSWISIVVSVASFIATVVTSIQQYKKFSEIAQCHSNIRHQSLFICNKIQSQLSINKYDRATPLHLLDMISLSQDYIAKHAPFIPLKVRQLAASTPSQSSLIVITKSIVQPTSKTNNNDNDSHHQHNNKHLKKKKQVKEIKEKKETKEDEEDENEEVEASTSETTTDA